MEDAVRPDAIDTDLYAYLPGYLQSSAAPSGGLLVRFCIGFVQIFIQLAFRIVLRPRREEVGSLDRDEVNRVYDQEAKTYDWKHHQTTYGMDTAWRRMAAWFVATAGRDRLDESFRVLDLCTGTGLNIVEMLPILESYGIPAEIVGLDYNEKMLAIATARKLEPQHGIHIRFEHGDATRLLRGGQEADGCIQFEAHSFDTVTQVCGIGGISDPLPVFQGILAVLKPGGQFFMSDMHEPIASQPGEIPFLLKWMTFPRLAAVTYKQSAVPFALHRLWAWRDPTLDFYKLPLVTWKETPGKTWGFKTLRFEAETQRWWFRLPVMPIARITVQKEEISETEHLTRQALLRRIVDDCPSRS